MGMGGFIWMKRADSQPVFFIDDKNRILFWPTKKGPGYIVDEETAIKILRESSSRNEYLNITILLLLISLGIIARLGSGPINFLVSL